MTALLGIPAEGGERRCGSGRSENGIYLESGLAYGGEPIENFLFDPTRPLPRAVAESMTKIGVTLIPNADGPHDVLDWIGTSHYPYAPDFIEEGRIKGFSRKVAPGLDFSLLGPGSRIIFAHARAHITNHEAFTEHLPAFACPCHKGHGAPHAPGDDCIGLLYSAAPAEVTESTPGYEQGYRYALPKGPLYKVGPLAETAPEPVYAPAMFGWGYITNIALIKNADGSHDQKKYDAAKASGLPVTPSDE